MPTFRVSSPQTLSPLVSQTGGGVSEFTGNETQSSGHCVMCSGKPRTKAGRCNAALNELGGSCGACDGVRNEVRQVKNQPLPAETNTSELRLHSELHLKVSGGDLSAKATRSREKLRLYRQILNFTSQSEFKHLVWWRPRAFLTCPAGFPHTWSKHCSSEH